MPVNGPYLKAALLCENVIEDKQGVLSLIRVIDRFTQTGVGPAAPAEMPPLTVSVVAVLMFVSGEARGAHEIQLEIEKPSGLRQSLGSSSVHFEGEDRGANIVARLQLVLDSQGLYWIDVRLGDEVVTRMPLRVVYGRISPGSVGPTPPGPG
jgi:hypothetical protein